jgi:hypothetical protein
MSCRFRVGAGVSTDCECCIRRFRYVGPEDGVGGWGVTRKLIGLLMGALNGTCPLLLPTPAGDVRWPDQKLVRSRRA